MVESLSLQLVFASSSLHEQMTAYLTRALTRDGFVSVTPPMLNFLSILECGVNYASDIARNLGVSRQMVAKTLKELCHLGYLEQIDGKGRQKMIRFTEQGEHLISAARQYLVQLDEVIGQTLGDDALAGMIDAMQTVNGLAQAQAQET
ncbi:Uncharacterised protein [BD1-7 clade bacterium]|uniref:Uncharacterized protein n=1 Tax=BD1-7 clade bacterium TaxID=2029982 RepID=A0A5S9NPJ5_9GAMM|nr:Uncharacterised protein [BD1-7 clade bacterium]